jgi:hypothetical protein
MSEDARCQLNRAISAMLTHRLAAYRCLYGPQCADTLHNEHITLDTTSSTRYPRSRARTVRARDLERAQHGRRTSHRTVPAPHPRRAPTGLVAVRQRPKSRGGPGREDVHRSSTNGDVLLDFDWSPPRPLCVDVSRGGRSASGISGRRKPRGDVCNRPPRTSPLAGTPEQLVESEERGLPDGQGGRLGHQGSPPRANGRVDRPRASHDDVRTSGIRSPIRRLAA